MGRCGVVGSTLAFGSIGNGFEYEHRLFSHHGTSAFSKLRSLAKCSLHDSVRRLLYESMHIREVFLRFRVLYISLPFPYCPLQN